MHCPNCGQQQVSEEMRYCSRCGFSLAGLAEWLAGGRVPLQAAEKAPDSPDSRRRKNMRRAAKLMFFSAVLFPLFLVISIAEDEPGPLILPFFMFFIALMWMLYARLFMSKAAPVNYQAPQSSIPSGSFQTSTLGSGQARGSLPPAADNIPISGPTRQQVRTNELAQRPSVTEHTTRLLDNE
jgi:hypothetical protein